MVPLARALAGAGHSVAFSTGEALRTRVEGFGFRCYPAGPDVDEMHDDAFRRRPELRDLPPERAYRIAAAIFAGRVGPTLAQLDDVGPAPDLVVHDAYELTGPVLAARHGAPWVTHGLGPRWPEVLEEAAGEDVADVWRREGAAPPPRAGLGRYLYLEVCPPELRSGDAPPGDAVGEIRPEPVAEDIAPDGPLFAGDRRWRVYATLGTVTTRRPEVFRAMLEAFDGQDYEVLLTVGPSVDVTSFGAVPANVRLEPYVPQASVLSQCDAVVCHGGSGTVLAAYAQGLPLVIAPQGTDQFRNVPFYARPGAAVVLQPADFDAGTLRAAVDEVLRTERYREAAQGLRASIAAMPPPESWVRRLEDMVQAS